MKTAIYLRVSTDKRLKQHYGNQFKSLVKTDDLFRGEDFESWWNKVIEQIRKKQTPAKDL